MTTSEHPSPLQPDQMSVRIDPALMPFATMAEEGIKPYRGVIGQQGARNFWRNMEKLVDSLFASFPAAFDFDDHLPRNAETVAQMMGLVKDYVECSGFAPLSAGPPHD